MLKKHVFISYCKEDRVEIGKLRDDLISLGETLWWDQDISPGEDWQVAIRTAMRNSYAILACFSKATDNRYISGMFPELLDAVKEYRTYAPGGIYLIPVRFSNSTIPDIEISGTTTLRNLQYVDLFPSHKRSERLAKLLTSIQAGPSHP